MDIDKCRILVEAVDCGSLSAAAAKLGYTTAGVSYNVDAVENELGFPIIKRGHSGISLTANGRKIMPTLRELIQTEEKLENEAQSLRKQFNGEITIGTFSSIAIRIMPNIISGFQKDYPDVTIRIVEGVQQELEDHLEKGEIDLCLCSYRKKSKFDWIPLHKDPELVVLPPNHPLAKCKKIEPQQLKDQPLIVPAYGKDPDVIELLNRYGVDPYIKYTTVETDTAFAMVAHGFGIVVTNEMTILDRVQDLVVRPFSPPQFIMEGIYINQLDSASRIAKRFVKYLETYFEEEK